TRAPPRAARPARAVPRGRGPATPWRHPRPGSAKKSTRDRRRVMPHPRGDARACRVSRPAGPLAAPAVSRAGAAEPAVARRNHVGTISLLCAVGGMVACRVGLVIGPFAGERWLWLLAAGFEAATVGALADWFAVTALFRHPLGLPIPHTAIIPTRRAKIVESIANIVEN